MRETYASQRSLRRAFAVITIAATAFTANAFGQTDAADLPFFRDQATLQVRLEVPLRALRRNTRERPEHDGRFRYVDAAGNEVELDVEVRVRGNSRLEQCDFPPLRLDFRRGQLSDTILAGQNRLKLVTLCKTRDSYRDYLQLEHDVYLLFNALTDYSFRVRKASVEYVSTDSRREEIFTEPAFFIEEDWEVAARHETQVIEQEQLSVAQLDADHFALLSVFHYIIGNTDWSALRAAEGEPCCHNGRVIGSDASKIVVPYDFDQAGFINADYARPVSSLPIRTVRQRLYRGFCVNNQATEQAIERIVGVRSILEDVIVSSEASESAKEKALAYLRESLDILAMPDSRSSSILEKCR